MESLQVTSDLRLVFSHMFVLYFRSHTFHWNVTGMFFPQLHKLFEDLYETTWKSLDDIAEHIRSCGELAPTSIIDVLNLLPQDHPRSSSTIPGTSWEMIQELVTLNGELIGSLLQCRISAVSDGKFGVVNFVEGLLDKHDKLNWMLKSTIQDIH